MNEDQQEVLGVHEEQLGPVFAGPGAKHDRTPFRLLRLSSSQKDALDKAKKYAMEQNIKTVLVKQTIAHQQQQMQSMQSALQKQQAWSLMCRIYVGSINFEINEDTVRQAFLPFGPMKSFHLAYDAAANKHKGFAFVEYETPEAASLALEQMNGVILGGRNIRVGRPSNMPQAQAIIENYLFEAQQYHRIYVASVHPDLNESDLKCVFEAFGKVLSCKLPPDPLRLGKHKGYAFIRYDNPQSANDAVSAMNLFDIGGQYLRVGKAVTPPNVNLGSTSAAPMPTATAVAAAAITAKLTVLDAANQDVTPPNINLGSSAEPMPTATAVAAAAITAQLTLLDAANQAVTPSNVNLVSNSEPMPTATAVAAAAVTANLSVLDTANQGQDANHVQVTLPGAAVQSDFGWFPDHPMQVASHVSDSSSVDNQSSSVSTVTLPDVVLGTISQSDAASFSGADLSIAAPGKPNSSDDERNNKILESRVIVLCNLVDKDDVDDELRDEVYEECSKYGDVQRIIIYDKEENKTAVKIFVEFSDSSASERAIASLNGRFFGGRQISADFFNETLYEKNCFTE